MGWDASTIAAVAALIIACLALIIALAQVLQQYFITGQLIRLCDSVVFGPLPGQGRRIWQLSQFRFRVIYSIPQISLDASLWPEESPHIKSYAVGKCELPPLGTVDLLKEGQADEGSRLSWTYTSVKRQPRFRFALKRSQTVDSAIPKPDVSCRKVGEAAWASFCRVAERPCGDSVRFDFVEYDADRCPPDLVTAPMQVSMRDIIVMGLMAGMEMTSCSFEEKSVSMQGEVGTITSSNHPILGPILHFTPRDAEKSPPSALGVYSPRARGIVENRWLARTWNVCRVAQKYFHSGKRRTARRLDERWISDKTGLTFVELSTRAGDHGEPDSRDRSHKGEEVKTKTTKSTVEARTGSPRSGRHEDRDAARNGKSPQTSRRRESESNADDDDIPVTSRGRVIKREPIRRYPQDGPWTITIPQEPPREINVREKGNDDKNNNVQSRAAEAPEALIRETTVQGEAGSSGPKRHATVEDYADDESSQIIYYGERPSDLRTLDSENLDRVQTARIRQAARGARLREIQRDKSLVEESVKKGVMLSPYQPTRLLLTQYPHNPDQDTSGEQPPKPTTEEEAARQREEERQRLRRERDAERVRRNDAHRGTTYLFRVDMFWMCQMDIFRGFWATPWQHVDDVPMQAADVGAVTVILEALLGFLDDKSLIYTGSCPRSYFSFQDTARWLFDGNCTYPAYAINARGGVISTGVYCGVRIPAFGSTVIPALELLYSYEWQVDPEVRDQTRFCEEQNVELMRLDSWLSYVGRTDEIIEGPKRLLKQTPALVSLLIDQFEDDFQNIDLSASDGGLQDIQGLAANIMDFLTDEELTEAEQLYVLIALLRAVKVGQSVLAGADTHGLHDILIKDVQVHLV